MTRDDFYKAVLQCISYDPEGEGVPCEACPLRDVDNCNAVLTREVALRYMEGDTKICINVAQEETEPRKAPVNCVKCRHYKADGHFVGFWYCAANDRDMNREAFDPAEYYCAEGAIK